MRSTTSLPNAIRNRGCNANVELSPSFREQLFELGVDEVDVFRIGAGTAREMAPDRGHRNEFGVRHMGNLELAVFGRKVQVGLTRHDIGLGLDGTEGRLEVALVELVVADIAVLPGPEHGQEIVR